MGFTPTGSQTKISLLPGLYWAFGCSTTARCGAFALAWQSAGGKTHTGNVPPLRIPPLEQWPFIRAPELHRAAYPSGPFFCGWGCGGGERLERDDAASYVGRCGCLLRP